MKIFTIVMALASCATHASNPGPDAYCPSKGLSGCPDAATAGSDAGPSDCASSCDAPTIRDTSPPSDAYTCTPSIAGGCCVFAGTCGAGSDCTYGMTGSATPSQADGTCVPDRATPEGGPCFYNNGNGNCAPGLYCAWNNGQIMQTGPNAGEGTCRAVCDPTDTAAHGCASGKSCVGMPYCAPGDHFPDCASVATANIGYCL